jgi:predicted DCC family thiol-disulfide oxidoreductase YuxK
MAGRNIQWVDVHTQPDACREIGSELEFVRERLHAVDERGDIHAGIDAFAVIWRHSPGEEWKARLISLPVIQPVCRVLYNLFARLLYKWNRWLRHW